MNIWRVLALLIAVVWVMVEVYRLRKGAPLGHTQTPAELANARTARLIAEQQFQMWRAEDPLLDYFNPDVTWVVCTANMGPGGDYFSGVELHALETRIVQVPEIQTNARSGCSPYERVSTVMITGGRAPVYRIIAIGLSEVSARKIAAARNLEVLGSSDGRAAL